LLLKSTNAPSNEPMIPKIQQIFFSLVKKTKNNILNATLKSSMIFR
jgi:hypothetical protein